MRAANIAWSSAPDGIRITITGQDQRGQSAEVSAVILDAEEAVRNICRVAGLPAPWKASR